MAFCGYCSRVEDEEHLKVCYRIRYPDRELQAHLQKSIVNSIDQARTIEQANQGNEDGNQKPVSLEKDNADEHVTGYDADADTASQPLAQTPADKCTLQTSTLATTLSQMYPVPPPDTTTSSQTEEDHELNSQCRNDFLHFLSCCHGKEASLRMFESSRDLTCRVEAFQPQLKHIAVSNLTTPIGTEKSAIIRTNDLIQVRYFKENNTSN